jgi:hypothetical protein
VRAWRAAVVGAAALACALLAATPLAARRDPASWEPRCEYVEAGPPGPRGNRLVVYRKNGLYSLQRQGKTIRIVFQGDPDMRCRGSRATIYNVDRIVLKAEHGAVTVDEGPGSFVPGASPERSGPEIEIFVDVRRLEWKGSDGRDRAGARTLSGGRVGLQRDAAADGSAPDYDLVLPRPPNVLKLAGGHGADRLSTRGLTNMGDPGLQRVIRLFGEQGNDALLGGPRDEGRLEDGAGDDLIATGGGSDEVALDLGHDTVYGGGGNDNLYYAVYGRGNRLRPDLSDRLYGGPGKDLLSDENRHRDLLDCGPGKDIALREGRDRPQRNCEWNGVYRKVAG